MKKERRKMSDKVEMHPFAEGELIYSRKYGESAGMLDDLPEDYVVEIPKDISLPTFDEFMRKVTEESTYEIRPDGLKMAQSFVGYCKLLSEEFLVDIDITQRAGFISAALQLSGFYLDDFAAVFSMLLALSDSVSVMPTRNRPDHITVTLTCHTHDHYVAGKKQVL